MVKCVPFGLQVVEMCQPQVPVTITEVASAGRFYSVNSAKFSLQNSSGNIVLENLHLKATLKTGVLDSLVLKHSGR